MAFRRSRVNIRRPYRRRRAPVRRASYSRSRYSPRTRYASSRRPYRRRTGTVRRRPQACSCPGELSPGDKFVMTQSDPFEPKYFGSKIPDSSTLPSIPTPLQYNQTLTTLVGSQPNWAAAWAFYPSVRASFVTALGLNASQWSFSTANATVQDAPQFTSFSSQFEAFRPTAHAIRLSCPFAPTSTTGFVHIAIATETIMSGAGAGVAHHTNLAQDLQSMSGYSFYKRVTLASLTQSPITLINKWTDETAFRYQSPYGPESTVAMGSNGALSFQVPFSWGTLLVAVEGVSAVTTPGAISPLQAEIILHSECIPDKNSTLIGSTAAAYNSGVLNAVSQAVAQTDFAHTEEQQDSTIRSFVSEVSSAIGMSSNDVSNLAGSLARSVVGGVVDYTMGRYGVGGVNNYPDRLAIM